MGLEILEGGTVVKTGRGHLVVEVTAGASEPSAQADSRSDSAEVDGVEVFVDSRLHRTGCTCCGDWMELQVSYNRRTEDRVEDHGEADPLGIE